jgi:hypothetical protein
MAWRADVLDQLPSDCVEAGTVKAEARLKQDAAGPQVLVVGSSLTAAGLIPEQLAGDLGLPASEVKAFSLGGGTPWDALVLFRRNPQLLDTVRLVVFDINHWQLDEAVWEIIQNRFLWQATLEERWRAPGWRKVDGVADWFWPCFSQRRELRGWLLGVQTLARHAARPSPGESKPAENVYWKAYDDQQIRARALGDSKYAPTAMASGLAAMRWSPAMERSLHELLRLLHERGVRVLLHQQPRHPDYLAWVEEHPEARDNYESYLRFVRGLTGPDVRVQVWEKPEEVGLGADDFLDYAHLGRPGAETYTRAIGRLIVDDHLLPGAATQAAHRAGGPTLRPARERVGR